MCDDGNDEAGDGCFECQIEFGWDCHVSPLTGVLLCNPICGDGVRVGSEECDDGNLRWYDGCSFYCTIEPGFECDGSSADRFVQQRTHDSCTAQCGDGVQSYYVEGCDDGNLIDGDGCSSTCRIEDGWHCEGGWTLHSHCTPVCGDGIRMGSEQCDDGNTLGYDGCDPYCMHEDGWDCTSGDCTAICGDGMRIGAEWCDDGNTVDGDGCSTDCFVEWEDGWVCWGNFDFWRMGVLSVPHAFDFLRMGPPADGGDSCELFQDGDDGRCGSGVLPVGSHKQCDDGNSAWGDGCNPYCYLECGYDLVDGQPVAGGCGDKRLAHGEQCDDGNQVDGDGCSSDCRIETGYTCIHYASPPFPCGAYGDVCTPVCGDGLRVGF